MMRRTRRPNVESRPTRRAGSSRRNLQGAGSDATGATGAATPQGVRPRISSRTIGTSFGASMASRTSLPEMEVTVMRMLPPTTISLPFKVLLFVMADGWYLISRSLVTSFSG